MFDVVRAVVVYGSLSGAAHALAIFFVDEAEERFGRPDELTERHAEDAVRLRRPAERVRGVELGDPAADVRDFLRLLEKRAMLLDALRLRALIRRCRGSSRIGRRFSS